MARRRARFGKRSKRAILWAAATFVLGHVVAGLLLDYVFPTVRFPMAAQVADQVARESVRPNVVFLGSSRTGAAVDVEVANKVLGAESPTAVRVAEAPVLAGDSLSAEVVFQQLLARDVRPQWLVVEVSPETLNTTLPFMRENAARVLKWNDLSEHSSAIVKSRAGWIYLESRLVPIYTHRRELVRTGKRGLGYKLSQPPANPAPKPASGAPPAPGRPVEAGEPAAPQLAPMSNEEALLKASQFGASTEVRRWLRNYTIGGMAPAALERLLSRCRDEQVKVVLLGIPACTAHRQEFTPAIEQEYLSYIERLVREFGCRFVDARDWVPDALYEDALHLRGVDGAGYFTRRFTRDVLLNLPRD
jgi:hypothetical protein